jgi:hypothetical protein
MASSPIADGIPIRKIYDYASHDKVGWIIEGSLEVKLPTI